MQINDYEVLGLKPGATAAAVKAAYRELAKQWHPDLQTDPVLKEQAEAKLKKINAAYDRLQHLLDNNPNGAGVGSGQVNVGSQPRTPTYFYDLGLDQLQQQQYQDALESFSQAIKLNPGYGDAYAQRAEVCQQLGFEHRAASDRKNAVKYRAQAAANTPAQPVQSATHPENVAAMPGWRLAYNFLAPSYQATIHTLALKAAQGILITAAADNMVKLWDLETQKLIYSIFIPDLQTLALSPDGQQMITAGKEDSLQLWPIRSQKPHPGQLESLRGNKWPIQADKVRPITFFGGGRSSQGIRQLVFSSDGQYLLWLGKDEVVKVWHLPFQKLVHVLKKHNYTTIATLPNQAVVLLGDDSGHIHQFQLNNGRYLGVQTVIEQPEPVSGIAVAPDGSTLAIRSIALHTIPLWDFSTGKLLRTLSGHKRPVTGVQFDPTGKYLVSSSSDRTIKIWHVDTGNLEETLDVLDPLDMPTSLLFSADSQTLISGWQNGSLRIWKWL